MDKAEKELNPDETLILDPVTGKLLHWNSWFQKYYSDDGKVSITYQEYKNQQQCQQD